MKNIRKLVGTHWLHRGCGVVSPTAEEEDGWVQVEYALGLPTEGTVSYQSYFTVSQLVRLEQITEAEFNRRRTSGDFS